VYCPKSGDPCYESGSGANSFATNMAYRWNLDYVVDPHGNTIAYTYQPETNYYARGSAHTNTQYVRDGYLKQISYGWRSADVAAQAKPAEKVLFTPGQRCTGSTTECSSYANLNSTTSRDWPDTPYDQVCQASGTCTNGGVSYFTTDQLNQIQTVVNEGGADKIIDTYTLAHSFPSPGDSSSPSLWLDGITHTGNDAAAAVSLPQVTFGGEMMPNRVPGSGTYPDYAHQRLTSITTETGEQISVSYTTTTPSVKPCSQTPGAQVLPSTTNNAMLCYQQYWGAPSQQNPISDWFEKYVVSTVRQIDLVAASPTMFTSYTYVGTPAWHRDDSPQTKNAQRSWNQFRGFGQVLTESGDPSSASHDPITETSTSYLRGMNGDYTSQTGGSQRSVTVTDSLGDQVVDNDLYADLELESDVYDRAGGTIQSKEVNLPWSAQTASHAEPTPVGLSPETAGFIDTGTTKTADLLAGGAWRSTKTVNVYDAGTGLLKSTDTQGDQSLVGTAGSQETCTTTTHASAPGSGLNIHMVNSPARVTTVSVTTGGPVGTGACPAPTRDNTVSDAVTYYDGKTSPGAIGAVGNVTRVDAIDGFQSTTPSYVSNTTGAVYDAYGRQTATTDARGLTTRIDYTPASGALPTSTVDTNVPKGWTTTTTLDQGRQLPTKVVDLNGNTTVEAYDGLGRLTGVWLPGRGTGQSASTAYAYHPGGNASPSWTQTKTLRDDGTYAFAYSILDGPGRVRQTQSVALDGSNGTLVSDTFYDSHGWTVKQSSPYYEKAFPASTIYPAADASVPGETVSTYDGQGRVLASVFNSYAHPQWQTTTGYPGADRTDVTPPAGGTPTSTFTDALGRTSALWNYATPTPTGNASDARVISYTYTPDGGTATVTGPAGEVWTYGYDLHGNQTAETDPDAGNSSATYDAAGDVLTSTDGRGQTVAYSYDPMGRKIAEYSGSTTGTLLGTWTYDTAPLGLGLLANSTSYVGSGATAVAYTSAIDGYTNRGAATGSSITIPGNVAPDEVRLAGTYHTTTNYSGITGQPRSVSYGADGGLPAETVNYTYDQNGSLVNLAGLADYLTSAVDDPFARPTTTQMGDMPNQVVVTNDYDTATGRVSEQFLDKESGASHVEDVTTLYNPAGMVTATTDVQDGTTTDLQCYGYNQLDQLTSAWSDKGGVHTTAAPSVPNIGACNTTTPSAANLGGPAKYWQSYDYNAAGNRTTEVDHSADGNTANDATHAYHYTGATGTGGQPDTLQSVTNSGPAGTSTDTYKYDTGGNTSSWSVAGGAHDGITYTPQGQTATITDGTTGNVAGYTYDADGDLLLQRDTQAGATTVTLYLGDAEQLTLDAGTKQVTGQRYYPTPGGPTEVRSSDGTLTYEYANSQNTGEVTIDAGPTQTVTRRYFTPYGQIRGPTAANWVDNRTFLDQPTDPVTGLDLLGDRNYDAATGHFLQRDPVQELTDFGQLSGYTYAADNPVNGSDPTGDCMFSDGDLCISQGSQHGQTIDPSTSHDVTAGDHNCCTAHSSGNNNGGGTPKAKPKKCGTFDVKCHAKKIAHAANNFYQAHKAIIATIADYAVTTAAFSLCEAATDGAGTLGCAMLAGALGNVVNHALNPQAGDDSPLGFATDALTGAAMGAAGVGAGKLLGTGAKALARTGAGEQLMGKATSLLGKAADAGGSKLAKAAEETGCSFTATTLVLMADGSTKPIGSIAVGDRVESGDPASTGTQAETVTVLHDDLDSDLADLTVADAAGHAATIHTTQNHPFWDATTQEWTQAGQLPVGDQLRTATGETVRVEAVADSTGLSEMFNLTVTEFHTYYVVAGKTPILVHNCPAAARPNIVKRALAGTGHFMRERSPRWVNAMATGYKAQNEWSNGPGNVASAAAEGLPPHWSTPVTAVARMGAFGVGFVRGWVTFPKQLGPPPGAP
jgi:RHS repeat-associated protein